MLIRKRNAGVARLAALLIVFFVLACGFRGKDMQTRPEHWSRPVANESVNNFYKVNDHVYRSAQPGTEGLKVMYEMGIRHVLNLRSLQTDSSRAGGLELTLHNVKMFPHNVEDGDIIEALRIINSVKEPLLVHCLYGSDRTGVVIAMYRIIFEKWTKEQAIEEMIHGGYGFHKVFRNIPSYIKNADIERIRAAVMRPGSSFQDSLYMEKE